MIIGLEALRDGGRIGPPCPPGRFLRQFDEVEAPTYDTGGFFVGETDYLKSTWPSKTARNKTFREYMSMDKGLVTSDGVDQLMDVHSILQFDSRPQYLVAAGWAAAEAALMASGTPEGDRLTMLDCAAGAWARAFRVEMELVQRGSKREGNVHRAALSMAVLPLFRGVIKGNVTNDACRKSFDDCLMVARSNNVALEAARTRDDNGMVAYHSGIGYECNALLAMNRELSNSWFAIPAMSRCDSGLYQRNATHDLLVIHQKYGTILSATPIEIKSVASRRDKQRYLALLVRGKMHLSVPGKYQSSYTLAAIGAVYDGTGTKEDIRIADHATGQLKDMIRDYYAGEVLGKIVCSATITTFRDNARVVARHPGLGHPNLKMNCNSPHPLARR